MSWLLKSLQITDDSEPSSSSSSSSSAAGGGVKEDLSVLGQTIGRQLRGVAAFLAPPPCFGGGSRGGAAQSADYNVGFVGATGASADLDERGREETEFESEDDEFNEVPGISEEVIVFAKEISTRPGCWTDFPLSLDNDFKLSDAQRAHTSAIEQLVPGLTDVKNEVSRCMNDEQFWLIYFILLMPRVNGHDLELLATSKVVETRDLLLQKLQEKREARSCNSSEDDDTSEENESRETENVDEIVEKAETLNIGHEEKSEESSGETERSSREDEEDISFSDLEADDDTDFSGKPPSNTNVHNRRVSNASGSSDWIQLNRSPRGGAERRKDSEGESSDWFAVGDSD
ncbi:PREDICTED: uncharacterized protein LOC104809117 [Tarenaya hassleriana]|uniref:uncharacterized protein LOC104809117 n=1 Tax=Tarenaya hassleriana TaxID=28532 RepID=UPI00053C85EF|nr:PREDICTED: uncharacterized protein LOC104809117 [Tarenaya hassleriana]